MWPGRKKKRSAWDEAYRRVHGGFPPDAPHPSTIATLWGRLSPLGRRIASIVSFLAALIVVLQYVEGVTENDSGNLGEAAEEGERTEEPADERRYSKESDTAHLPDSPFEL